MNVFYALVAMRWALSFTQVFLSICTALIWFLLNNLSSHMQII